MSSTTPNLHLVKPSYNDIADIGDINGNMDLIDSAYASMSTSITNIDNSKEPILTKGSLVGSSQAPIDLNDYKETGLYFVTVNAYIDNAPVAPTSYGYLEVLKSTSGATLQRFTRYASSGSSVAGNTYIRNYANSAWQDWVLLNSNVSNSTNMLYGGDDLRYKIEGSASVDLSYPFSKYSSTYSDGKCCVAYTRSGLVWNSSGAVMTETDKYSVINLCVVPGETFPLTVTFYVYDMRTMPNPTKKKFKATFNSANTTPILGAGHLGYLKMLSTGDQFIRTLQWVIGRSETEDYDGKVLYDEGGNVIAIHVESGTRDYSIDELESMLNGKETRFNRYVDETVQSVSETVLTKGQAVGTNLNDYITNGIYYIVTDSSSQHVPVAMGINGYLEIWKASDTTIMQRFTTEDGTKSFIRCRTNSTWSSWVLMNDNLTANLLWGGDDLRNRYNTSGISYTTPPDPIKVSSTTYSNSATCIGADDGGLLWQRSVPEIVDERNKYTVYNLCEVNGTYPITVTFLISYQGTYHALASATITDSTSKPNVWGGATRDKRLGYLQVTNGKLQWVIGRSESQGYANYDAEMLYSLGSDGRIEEIRCEYSDRMYTKDEMIKLMNPTGGQVAGYINSKIDAVYDTVATVKTYPGLNTASKTLVGAINELLVRFGG